MKKEIRKRPWPFSAWVPMQKAPLSGRERSWAMYDNETRVRLVKKRVEELERQRARRVRAGACMLAAFAAVTALGAALCPRRTQEKGE